MKEIQKIRYAPELFLYLNIITIKIVNQLPFRTNIRGFELIETKKNAIKGITSLLTVTPWTKIQDVVEVRL